MFGIVHNSAQMAQVHQPVEWAVAPQYVAAAEDEQQKAALSARGRTKAEVPLHPSRGLVISSGRWINQCGD